VLVAVDQAVKSLDDMLVWLILSKMLLLEGATNLHVACGIACIHLLIYIVDCT